MQKDATDTNGWKPPAGLPQRWLIVTQNYAPERGAAQVRLGILASILRDLGLQVEVFTGMPYYPTGIIPEKYRGKWTDREVIDGIVVHRTWVYPYMGYRKLLRIWNFCSFTASGLINMFRLRRPDVLFIESFPLPVGVLGLLARIIWRVPYIYNIPDMQIQAAREMWLKNELILGLAAKFENTVMRSAHSVSTVTFRFREHFHRERGIPLRRITMLPNGADTRMLGYRPPDPEVARKYGVEGKIVFVYAGTLGKAHAPHVMVEAAELLRSRDDIRILVVGGGPERQSSIDLAHAKGLENIVFGESSFAPQELPALMSIARAALVSLSDTPVHKMLRVAKTFPALACRKAVIFSGDCESGEIVRDRGCAIVTAPEDPRSLAEAMVRLADNEQEAETLGRVGAEYIQEEMNWMSIVKRWLDEMTSKSKFPT